MYAIFNSQSAIAYQGRISSLTPMTQTPPHFPSPPPSPFLPPLFPSIPSLFAFPITPFPPPSFPSFPLPRRGALKSARGLGECFSSPAGSGAEPRPLMHSGWIYSPGNAFIGSYLQYNHQYDPYISGNSSPLEGGILSPLSQTGRKLRPLPPL